MVQSAALLLIALVAPAVADIYTYQDEPLQHPGYFARRVEMYNEAEAPAKSKPGNGRAYVQLDLTITKKDGAAFDKDLRVQISLVEAKYLEVGYTDDKDQQWICCFQDIASDSNPYCQKKNVGELMITNSDSEKQVKTYVFNEGETEERIQGPTGRFQVLRSGPHILVFSNCNAEEFTVTGKVLWMNPYGYLPAMLYHFMPFYGGMSLVYLACALTWGVLNAMHWKDIITLQNLITCVLAICLLENMVWYFDYVDFNNTGERGSGPLVTGLILTTTRRTVSRMLIMAVSVGFAIVRPDLGQNKQQIILFGAVYFFFQLAAQVTIEVSKVHNVDDRWRILLSLPLAVIDAGCYWWVFISLYHLITQLRIREQYSKLAMYKQFTKVLIASLLFAVACSSYHYYLISTNTVLDHWELWWFLEEGVWNVLYAVVFVALMFVFRPSQNSKRYSYGQVPGEMAQEDFGLDELTGKGDDLEMEALNLVVGEEGLEDMKMLASKKE